MAVPQSFHIPLFALLSLSCWLTTVAAEYHWPSPQFDAIEALLYEKVTEPPNSLLFTGMLGECVPVGGENTVAEWIRFVRAVFLSISCTSLIITNFLGLP